MIEVRDEQVVPIRETGDVVRVRRAVRDRCRRIGLGLVEQTKTVTAASELARNALDHGGGGEALVQEVSRGEVRGLRVEFRDDGPGIADVERALEDGFSTGPGLGLGLAGAGRLVDEMDIRSAPGQGTRVTIVRWRS